jgi:hypothetical protein
MSKEIIFKNITDECQKEFTQDEFKIKPTQIESLTSEQYLALMGEDEPRSFEELNQMPDGNIL